MPNTKYTSKPKAEEFKFLSCVLYFQPYWYKMARQANTATQAPITFGWKKKFMLNIGKGNSNKILITTQRSK